VLQRVAVEKEGHRILALTCSADVFSVLQCVVVKCSVLQVLQCVAVKIGQQILAWVSLILSVYCSVLQRFTVYSSVLQCVAVCCSRNGRALHLSISVLR